MNATEFRSAIKQLGMTQRFTSQFFRRNRTTGIRWAKDGAPEEIELWLEVMLGVQSKMHIRDVPEWIYKMAGRSDSRRIDKLATEIEAEMHAQNRALEITRKAKKLSP